MFVPNVVGDEAFVRFSFFLIIPLLAGQAFDLSTVIVLLVRQICPATFRAVLPFAARFPSLMNFEALLRPEVDVAVFAVYCVAVA